MSIALIPYRQPSSHFCRLDRFPVDSAEWLLDDRPDAQLLGDLTADDHVLVIASSRMLTMRTGGLRCPVSVLMGEPMVIQKRLYHAIRFIASRFQYVFTHSTELLAQLPNARFVAHGGTFLDVVDRPLPNKTKRVAIIASAKRDTAGQRLRHQLVDWASEHVPDLDALGLGYKPLDDKADGHDPYFFSVVIENDQEAGYFTEKIVDSFLCRSLPIYCGAPDIDHFFDPRGMIVCRSEQEARHAIRTLTVEEYEKRLEYLEANRVRALQFASRFPRYVVRLHDLTVGFQRPAAEETSDRRAA